ncbi:uncharacterized protein LOC119856822 isoform X2 [Dermochelys coriacea]|nr:uncharacterized protein LOC119856822 isoform X2 [Dermochelys coriacea]
MLKARSPCRHPKALEVLSRNSSRCYLMPFPGERITMGSKGRLRDMGENFRKSLRDYVTTLVSTAGRHVRRDQHRKLLTGTQLAAKIKNLSDVMKTHRSGFSSPCQVAAVEAAVARWRQGPINCGSPQPCPPCADGHHLPQPESPGRRPQRPCCVSEGEGRRVPEHGRLSEDEAEQDGGAVRGVAQAVAGAVLDGHEGSGAGERGPADRAGGGADAGGRDLPGDLQEALQEIRHCGGRGRGGGGPGNSGRSCGCRNRCCCHRCGSGCGAQCVWGSRHWSWGGHRGRDVCGRGCGHGSWWEHRPEGQEEGRGGCWPTEGGGRHCRVVRYGSPHLNSTPLPVWG